MDEADVQLREELAAVQHAIWAHWNQYVLDNICIEVGDGCYEIPREAVDRWRRQMATPYADLTESEKDSDRFQVDKFWFLIRPS